MVSVLGLLSSLLVIGGSCLVCVACVSGVGLYCSCVKLSLIIFTRAVWWIASVVSCLELRACIEVPVPCSQVSVSYKHRVKVFDVFSNANTHFLSIVFREGDNSIK